MIANFFKGKMVKIDEDNIGPYLLENETPTS
jgi:hypothetical protein